MLPLIAHKKPLKRPPIYRLQAHEAIQSKFSHASRKINYNKTLSHSAIITVIASCCTAFVPRDIAAGVKCTEKRETQKKSGPTGDWLHSNGVHDAAGIESRRRARKAEELHARPHVGVVLYGQR